jgi:hypothetical protein
MIDEIEELHALADECREWANRVHISQGERVPSPEEYSRECKRLATKLDEIAKRLAARLPT